MNNYIPIKKKRNRRSNLNTIIMAARPSGGGKNKIRIRVTIPKKILEDTFGEIPKKVQLYRDIEKTNIFCIIKEDKGFKLTRTSENIYSFWTTINSLEYFLNIDYGESDFLKYGYNSIHFTIKEVKHEE